MGFMDRFYSMFGSKQSELFTAMLQPREIMNRGITPNDAEEVFAPFLSGLETAVNETYGSHEHLIRRNGQDITHEFTQKGLLISYLAQPLINQVPDDDDDPTIYGGLLSVKQDALDLTSVSMLLDKVRPLSLLACRQNGPDFQVFYNKGDDILMKGDELMSYMNLSFKEGCEFFMFPGIVTWRHVDLGGNNGSY